MLLMIVVRERRSLIRLSEIACDWKGVRAVEFDAEAESRLLIGPVFSMLRPAWVAYMGERLPREEAPTA